MQTDRSATLTLKITDKIPVREIEIESEAKTPDAELSTIESFDAIFNVSPIDDELAENLRQLGLYDAFLEKMRR